MSMEGKAAELQRAEGPMPEVLIMHQAWLHMAQPPPATPCCM